MLLSIFAFAWTAAAEAWIDVDLAFDTAATKLAYHDALYSSISGNYPDHAATGPNWIRVSASNWESGFYPGALWLMYERTGDATWMTKAKKWTAGIASQAYNTGTHDLGFMIFNSFGNGLRLMDTNDPYRPSYQGTVLTAASSLSQRFDADVGCTRSWGDVNNTSEFRVIIDNMMNLELLLAAHQMGGSAAPGSTLNLWEMAQSHADRTIAEHVRADGSTYHVVNYDPTTGDVITKYSAQGQDANSTWSRGQAWALYGFTNVYSYTRDPDHLTTATAIADYWIDHVPVNDSNYGGTAKDWVPMADFDSAYMDVNHKDSTAAAIAASGLFELSTLVADPALEQKYRDAATDTLEDLLSPVYFSTDQNRSPSLLLHGARRYPGDDDSYIWADYYLLESAIRYAQIVHLPGDYDGSGAVDAADYVVWRNGLGTTYTQNDYDVWRAHFGASLGSGSGSALPSAESLSAAVPESGSLLLVALAAAALSVLQRARSKRGLTAAKSGAAG